MVPRSSTPDDHDTRPLSAAAAEALRDAVRRAAAAATASRGAANDGGDPAAADRQLRAAVAAVAGEARERRMRPEELLAAFKAMLDAIPEAQAAIPGRVEQARLRERLVTLCIKAYYEG